MAISVQWDDNEKTILRYTISGQWDFAEYYEVLGQGRVMLQDISYDVAVIQDFSGTSYFPPSIITHARSVVGSRPANVGFVVFVNPGIFLQSIYKVLTKIIPNLSERYLMVNNNVEALQLIRNWQTQRQNTGV